MVKSSPSIVSVRIRVRSARSIFLTCSKHSISDDLAAAAATVGDTQAEMEPRKMSPLHACIWTKSETHAYTWISLRDDELYSLLSKLFQIIICFDFYNKFLVFATYI